MDMVVMELKENPECEIMKRSNIGMVKQEAPEVDNIPLQYEVGTSKSEKVSTDDQFQSTSLNTFDKAVISSRSLKLKSETVAQDLWLDNDQEITVKGELLLEELDIKSEDEAPQETPVDEEHNLGIKLSSGVKHFKCNICDYTFRYKRDLKRHLSNAHTGEKPFKCNICCNSYKQNGSLKMHLRTHTGEKPFKCDICDYSCVQKSDLKKHLITHTGEKFFKCNICDNRFTRNSNLHVHLRTHTGEKPFNCNICEISFGRNDDLKIHLRTHTGEKPFKCNICDHRFSQNGSLKIHLKTHSGEKPFKCTICDYRSIQKKNLIKHLGCYHMS